jgi:hypothetical protein
MTTKSAFHIVYSEFARSVWFNVREVKVKTNLHALLATALTCFATTLCLAGGDPATIEPLVRVVDLNIDDSTEVELCNGSAVTVKLLDLQETRDTVCFAVRRAVVTVEVNGERAELVSATYHLPQTIGGVQIDCAITNRRTERSHH